MVEQSNKIHWRILKRLLPILALILANYLYILTLEKCKGSEHKYIHIFRKRLNVFIKCGCLSAFIFSILLNLSIFKILHRIFVIIVLGNIIYLCFGYNTGYSLQNHGGWNRLMFLPACIIFTFPILILVPLARLVKKHPIIMSTLIIFILLLIIIGIKYRVSGSCANWEKGLAGVELDNSEPYCQIIVPEICYLSIMGRIFDFAYILHTKCSSERSYEIYNYVPKSAKNICFPRTEYFLNSERYDNFTEYTAHSQFQQLILKRLMDLDDPNLTKEKKEEIEVKINMENRKIQN